MMQAGRSDIIIEDKAFEKAHGIWSLSLIGAGTLSSVITEGKTECRFRYRLVCRADTMGR